MKISEVCQASYDVSAEQGYQCICERSKSGYQFNDLALSFTEALWFQLIGVLSALLNILLAWLIFRHKELQAHPMILFMVIALSDATLFWNQFLSYMTCTFKLPQLWLATT